MSHGWGASQRRATVWAKFLDGESGKELYLFNTHMDHLVATARLEGAKVNIAKMKKIAGRYATFFIVGDMNASYAPKDGRRAQLEPYYEWMWSARDMSPESSEQLSFNDWGLQGAPKATWNIDHIFYRGVDPIEYTVVDGADYGVVYISDHWPITMVCEF